MVAPIVRDLRKLVDKTPVVNVTIIDKSPIPSARGLATFDRDEESRVDIETTYTMEQIIDGTDGPVLHEDSNTEDPWDHVAKITGMVDPEFTDTSIILKPNGVFGE